MTSYYNEAPTIEMSSETKGKLYVAELVLKSLKIPYKIVKKPLVDYLKEKLNKK